MPSSLSTLDRTTTLDPRPTTGLGIALHAVGLERRGTRVLSDVTFDIPPGALVGIVGESGAGKSTLLELMAGVRQPTCGTVVRGGASSDAVETVGFVPQFDLLHADLPLATTVRHSARLRTAADRAETDRSVDGVLATLGLSDRRDVRVGELSGGQRKRASIAVELLAAPRALLLDEPTSGLDRATAQQLVSTLRELADRGTTIVFTTHRHDDLAMCDHVIEVADGTAAWRGEPPTIMPAQPDVDAPHIRRRPSWLTQWRVLTRRSGSLLWRQPLTVAIMIGAPIAVIAMFVLLYQPGAFGTDQVDASVGVSTTYWMAFAAFFFGLTYGLLQISTEHSIVRREFNVGVSVSAYLSAKVVALMPVLMTVDVVMLVVLRGMRRLPAMDTATWTKLLATLGVTSAAALALGLLVSAWVRRSEQATLALPMLCFPAVLFGGAIVPVSSIGGGGRAISVFVIVRWSFEALGHDLGLTSAFDRDSVAGPVLAEQYADALGRSPIAAWSVMASGAVALLLATVAVLRRRALPR